MYAQSPIRHANLPPNGGNPLFLHQNIDSWDSSKSEEIISDSIGAVGRWFPPGTPVSSTRKLISSPSFHRLDMTLAVAEALNPNKPINQTWQYRGSSELLTGNGNSPSSLPQNVVPLILLLPVGIPAWYNFKTISFIDWFLFIELT